MLFHSPEFVFGFLPACLLVFAAVHRLWGWDAVLVWLAAASLLFYGQWGVALAALLGASILFNYAVARTLLANVVERRAAARSILLGAIAADLGLLGYFKYTNFLIDNVNAVLGASIAHADIVLPIGISFYTFVQIGFLVEVYNRQVGEVGFGRYCLFSAFFPCVTAGPILLQREMMPQFADGRPAGGEAGRLAVGLTVFALGLFKKLLLADNLAPFADAVFDGAAAGAPVAPGVAWIGALAYTLQLYFDFSGYSDMALGLGFMFGLRLPLNFNSPLKAASITDFWRRWHMTMTRFFTNYLYSPIAMAMMRRAVRGGHGRRRRFLAASAMPVVVTFLLAGLWHGAGWTFVVFGLIHGVALAVNHGWREAGLPPLPHAAGWLLTMAVVVAGLVFFRADSVPVAMALLAGMAGVQPVVDAAAAALPPVAVDAAAAVAWIAALSAVVLACPNTQEIMHRYWFSSDPPPPVGERSARPARLIWRPTPAWAVAGAVVTALALGSMTGETVFLYYQF